MNVAQIGKAALKIYTCHVLVFTAGVIAGSVQSLFILCAIWGPCR
jgi:hypothetical protein